MRHQRQVLLNLRHVACARDDGGDRLVSQRILQRGCPQRDIVGGADALDHSGALQNFLTGGGIVVEGAEDSAGGEDAGVLGAANDHADPAPLAKRQEAVHAGLVEQG